MPRPQKPQIPLEVLVENLGGVGEELVKELRRAQLELFQLGAPSDDDSIDLQLRRARLDAHICSTEATILSMCGVHDSSVKYRKLALDASTEQSRIKRNAMWDRVNQLESKLNDRDQIPADLRVI